jgi:Ca2+-binding EF-hand superfamily protein
MGNHKAKEATLKSSELNEFHNMTLFSNEHILKLYDHYRHFSSLKNDDGVIDFDEFCLILNKKDKNLTKRIFDAIDVNSDGSVNFREFVKFISCFITGSLDEQIKLSYKIFSNRETKVIEIDTMCNLLKDIIHADESFYYFFDDDMISNIVNETFLKIAGKGNTYIDFEKYKEMIKAYPDILSWLRVDLDRIKKVNFEKNLKKKTCGFG